MSVRVFEDLGCGDGGEYVCFQSARVRASVFAYMGVGK